MPPGFEETAERPKYASHTDKSVYVSDGESSEKLQSAVDDSDDSQSSQNSNEMELETDPSNSSAHNDDAQICSGECLTLNKLL